ncbi:hypothetical protein SAMN05443579_1044 [Variovorax sp. PDC80]|uniref:phage head spike fiber domain-containing protein n=1 Tax=Variovorax sp. PDC80 TaxID=1882827 RepID=UPI0008E17F9D|nr:hypothetical protein [Variovorax sp. PDC80]SFO58657.1 hypothetical protein SAMN05443579_1044 [Variovorax sp. PDC80]
MGTTLTEKTFTQLFASGGGLNGSRVAPGGNIEASATPRFDFDPLTKAARGLLVEGRRANYLRQSSRFHLDEGIWISNDVNVERNSAVSPTGQQDAAKLVLAASGTYGQGNVRQTTTKPAAAGFYTASAYLKSAGGVRGFIYVAGHAGVDSVSANFDLVGNAHEMSATGSFYVASHKVEDAGNGWRRYEVTFQADASTEATFSLYPSSPTGNGPGDNVSGMYAWGAQYEAGTFASSVIQTTAEALLRTSDAATIFNLHQAPWCNLQEGTFYVQFVQRRAPVGVSQMIFGVTSNLDAGDRLLVYLEGNNAVSANVYRQWVEQTTVVVPYSVVPPGQVRKVVVSWKSGRFVIQVDALAPVVTGLAMLPNYISPALFLGHRNGGEDPIWGEIREFAYWPKAANPGEISAITPATELIAG